MTFGGLVLALRAELEDKKDSEADEGYAQKNRQNTLDKLLAFKLLIVA